MSEVLQISRAGSQARQLCLYGMARAQGELLQGLSGTGGFCASTTAQLSSNLTSGTSHWHLQQAAIQNLFLWLLIALGRFILFAFILATVTKRFYSCFVQLKHER